MKEIFVVGSSGHALVVDIVEKEQRCNVAGVFDHFKPQTAVVSGYSILGGHRDIPRLSAEMGVNHTIIGIGDNWDRYSVYMEIAASFPNMHFATCVHPS